MRGCGPRDPAATSGTGSRARARRTAVGLTVLLLGLAVASRADAQESESEARIRQGVELRRSGHNGEALVEFQKAFALDPSARARAQIGLALQALGDWLGAERWLGEALEATDDGWIEQHRGLLSGALATIQAHLGRLFVDATATPADVFVNGAPAQRLPNPNPIRVVAGTVDVAVRAPGYVDAHLVVAVGPGTDVHQSFALEREAPAVATPALPLPVPVAALADVKAKPRSLAGGYAGMGVATLFVAGGVVAWGIHEDAAAVWNDNSRCLRPGEGTRGAQCGQYQSAANVSLGVEIGAFLAAAGTAAAGVWLLWPVRTRGGSAAAWCLPSGALGIACGGRF
jgi:hypothetical protein